jgi:hypothetical protein
MSADFWMGCAAGFAFLFTITTIAIVLSKRMSAEHRTANTATMKLLKDANQHRDDLRYHVRRIADELEKQGGLK